VNTIIARRLVDWRSSTMWGFALLHIIALAGLVLAVTGALDVTAGDWLLAGTLFYGRAFFVAIGYHRYFAHRTFEFQLWCRRAARFLLAVASNTANQGGVIWWTETHMDHHRFSDQEGDHHSPVTSGFWWSHVGWLVGTQKEPVSKAIHLRRAPELVWLERLHWLPGLLLAAVCLWYGGLSGLLVGYFVSSVALLHATFTINSVAHLIGPQRYQTGDQSRNCWVLLPIAVGEQWHNNHHNRQARTRQGERWWEIDLAYYLLWGLEKVGLLSRLN